MEMAPSRMAARSVSGSMSSMRCCSCSQKYLRPRGSVPGCSRLRVIFEDWRVKRTEPFQACGTFTFNRIPGGKPSVNISGTKMRANCAAGLKSNSLPRYATEIAIDSGDDQVGLLFQDGVESQNHRVRGGAFDGIFVGRELVHVNRLAQRERLRGGAAFARRRNHGERGFLSQRVNQRTQAGGVNAVVVRDQNMRHEKSRATWRLSKNSSRRSGGEEDGRDDWI